MRGEKRAETRQHLVYDVVRRHGRGDSQRAISRALDIARDTVSRILTEQAERREQGESAIERALGPRRAPRVSKLDRYAKEIDAWL